MFLEIILIALYPNATHIIQPADVSVFRSLKCAWRKEFHNWRVHNESNQFLIKDFAPLLKGVLDIHLRQNTIKSGFEKSGLFPWNPDAVDYSKCLNLGRPKQEEARSSNMMSYDMFSNMCGEEFLSGLEHQTVNNFKTVFSRLMQFFKMSDNMDVDFCDVQEPLDTDLVAESVEIDEEPPEDLTMDEEWLDIDDEEPPVTQIASAFREWPTVAVSRTSKSNNLKSAGYVISSKQYSDALQTKRLEQEKLIKKREDNKETRRLKKEQKEEQLHKARINKIIQIGNRFQQKPFDFSGKFR